MTENKKIKKAKLSKEVEQIKRGLHFKEVLFVDYYLDGFTPYEALQLSQMDTDDKPADKKAAYNLIREPLIKLYISAIERQVALKSAMTLAQIDKKLTDMIDTDVTDMIEIGTPYEDKDGNIVTPVNLKDISELSKGQKATISSIKSNSGGVEIKLTDKLKAMEMLIKRRGGFKDVVDVNATANVQVYANVGNNGRQPK